MSNGWQEVLVDRAYRFLTERSSPRNLAVGYFGGVGSPVLPQILHLDRHAVWEAFFSNWLTSIFTVISALVLLVYAIAPRFLRRAVANQTFDATTLAGYRKHVDPVFLESDVVPQGLAWGQNATLVASPHGSRGWTSRQVTVDSVDQRPFTLAEIAGALGTPASECSEQYSAYVAGEFAVSNSYDARRFAVVRRSKSLSDDPDLEVGLRVTSWSQLQFFWSKFRSTDRLKPQFYRRAVSDLTMAYPSSFCLHLIVTSSDGQILLTRAHAQKANDNAGTWACSIGEQIDESDLTSDHSQLLDRWIARALEEEFALTEGDYSPEHNRAMALTYEGDIANIALVAVARLNLTASDFSARLMVSPRQDIEFSEIRFVRPRDVPQLLVCSDLPLHPSSGLRMMYATYHLLGGAEFRHLMSKALRDN